jgi:DNA-binding NarL/FixJ family response regulator
LPTGRLRAHHVLIAASLPCYGEAIAETLSRHPGVSAAAVVHLDHAQTSQSALQGSVVVADASAVPPDTLAAIADRLGPNVPMVAYGVDEKRRAELRAFTAPRAFTLIPRSASLAEVVAGVCRALEKSVASSSPGEDWSAVDSAFVRALSDRGHGKLTPRECDVGQFKARGLTARMIAGRLGISEHTVRNHLHNIYEKLGIHAWWQLRPADWTAETR